MNSILLTHPWRESPGRWTEQKPEEGWWGVPSCRSPGSAVSMAGPRRQDDWSPGGRPASWPGWSTSPVWPPGQSRGWSPSPGGPPRWSIWGGRLCWAPCCSPTSWPAAPREVKLIQRPETFGLMWNLMTIGLLLISPSLELILIWRVYNSHLDYFHFRLFV